MHKTSHNHYDFFTFPSGLRLVTVPMDSTKTATVLVLVATGSRYEGKSNNGISHFLEHLMFKGTKKRPGSLDISQELDSIGSEYNAFTSKEYTGYYVKCAAEKVDVALDVISDIFQNSKFDSEEINKERGPIKEEINMYTDHPPRRVMEIYDELTYGDQPLGWNIAGTKENVDKLQRDDFVKYFDTHYFAQNTVVAVAGNINPDVMKIKVGEHFSNIREHKQLKAKPVVEHQKEPGLVIEHKTTDQAHVALGFRGYGRFNPKYEALEILSVILGGGMSSRLFVEVRVKRGLAYRIRNGVSSYDETGDILTSAGLNNDNLMKGLKVILAEHRKLTEDPVPEKELKRMKDYVKGLFVISLEPSDAQAGFYGEQELLENKIETPEEKIAKIDAVSAEDIMEVAKEVFQSNKLNLAIVGPFEKKIDEIKEILNSW